MVVGYVVKYYYRYKLSLRDLREILLDRGIDVSHESLRSGCISLVPNMQPTILILLQPRRSVLTDFFEKY